MPSKKKKYNARFPAGRIKKIMQTDKEVGKVAQAVPIIISRTLELFVESLLTKSMHITQSRFARTLTPSHMKQCILSESRFDFLKDLVKNVPDASVQEDNENNLLFDADHRDSKQSSCQSKPQTSQSSTPQEERKKASSVIKYGPALTQSAVGTSSSSHSRKVSASESNSSRSSSYSKKDTVSTVCSMEEDETESEEEADDMDSVQTSSTANNSAVDNVPPLIPISNSTHSQVRSDSLVIDEDYDN